MKVLTFLLPLPLVNKLKEVGEVEGLPVSTIVRIALAERFEVIPNSRRDTLRSWKKRKPKTKVGGEDAI